MNSMNLSATLVVGAPPCGDLQARPKCRSNLFLTAGMPPGGYLIPQEVVILVL
jgi:hypothetical protein